jgi:hypothetical protein
MSTLVGIAIGAFSGVLGGAMAGMGGAFFVGYHLSLARILDGQARTTVARLNISPGLRLGGLVGLLTGGITGGSASLLIGLVSAALLVAAFYLSIRRDFGNPDKPVVLIFFIAFCGAFSGAPAGFAGVLLSGVI